MNLKELSLKSTKKLNQVMESRFGFQIDYDNLSYAKAQRLTIGLSEHLDRIRQSYGAHTAEQNPKYMEMLMVREGINSWLADNEPLMEGELETAEVVLAAKDMVDSVQSMVEDASKMLNEQLPPLLDTIRDQVGTAQGDAYNNTVTPALQALLENLNAARSALDSAARSLAGEQVDEPMDMGGDDLEDTVSPELPEPDLSDLDTEDDFSASDAATGGAEDQGRKRR